MPVEIDKTSVKEGGFSFSAAADFFRAVHCPETEGGKGQVGGDAHFIKNLFSDFTCGDEVGYGRG